MRNLPQVTIVDYGMGNLWSVFNAFKFIGTKCIVSDDYQVVKNSDFLILPGVGSFRLAMLALHNKGLAEAIFEAVTIKQSKIMGICLGFQMLTQSSTEDGFSSGLGFIPCPVERFSHTDLKGAKLPHIGFNQVTMPSENGLFSGFGMKADFYFVHSYRILPSGLNGQCAICNYGIDFLAAYQKDNIFGTQFHPEKSQTNGLRLLHNFITS